MSFLERVEKGILFRVTRAFALGVIVILAALLGLSIYQALETIRPLRGYPQPEEVFARLAPFENRTTPATKTEAREPDLSFVKLPFGVQKYFSEPESRARLLQQLASLPHDQRDGYLQNLAAVIDEAEKAGPGAAGNAAYVYMELTAERQSANVAREQERKNQLLELIGAGVASLMLIALFSLVLVLLAIERNTRSSRQPET